MFLPARDQRPDSPYQCQSTLVNVIEYWIQIGFFCKHALFWAKPGKEIEITTNKWTAICLKYGQFSALRAYKLHALKKQCVSRGVWELKREGGLHPILSPTKMKVRQNSFDCLSFCSSSCLSASLSACLPVFLPFYLPYGLSCFPIFFLFPLFPSFFLEIYSPTPFTVRRQGGLLDPPDPPSQTPLGLHPILNPTKLKVRQNVFVCLSVCLSSCLSASLFAHLPVFSPLFLPNSLSCLPIFFLFQIFPSFFLGVYSPTPFTVY